MDTTSIATLAAIILSTGCAATVTAGIKGIGAIRGGVRAQTREAIASLGQQRAEADEARRVAELDRDYWHQQTMRYLGQLVRNGIEPIPPDPVPPSERPPS